jgi:hypothetical protein
MRATAAYHGSRLHVQVDVEAEDVVDALAVAKELVLARLPGAVEVATVVATDGVRFPPGRLFGRRRIRRGS